MTENPLLRPPMGSKHYYSGELIRRHISPDLVELLLFYLTLLGVLSIPFTLVGLVIALHHGQPTHFPPHPPRLGFTPGPLHRGTVNVIWVCMSTIFTCVYVSIHLDVPPLEQSKFEPPSHGRLQRALFRAFVAVWHFTAKPLCRRIVRVVFNIFAPELVVFVAVLELFSARDGRAFMRACGQADWSLKLAFFADMGGFEWKGSGDAEGRQFLNGREFLTWFQDAKSSHSLSGKILDVKFLEEEINDRSKANTVLKAYTVLQASWLLIETVVRMAEGRAVSELEVATCAYIVCTVLSYGCWLRKPYDVGRPIILREDSFISSQPMPVSLPKHSFLQRLRSSTSYTRLEASDTEMNLAYPAAPLLDRTTKERSGQGEPDRPPELPDMLYPRAHCTPFNRSYSSPDVSWPLASHLAGLLGVIVSLIHAVPIWDTLFINTTGQWLWRFCCIVQTGVLVGIPTLSLIEKWYTGRPIFIMTFVGAFVYCASRVLLFALIWISFWSLPASVYIDIDWSRAYFPHWH